VQTVVRHAGLGVIGGGFGLGLLVLAIAMFLKHA
jgi:hypothetical protein